MAKHLLFMGSAIALGISAQAQTLPSPVSKIDFEGVSTAQDLGAEQVGAGLFLQSADKNFGTYYQNNPEGVIASHQNYLIIPTQAFINSQAKSNEQFTIAFWMNAYVANEKQGTGADGHYFSTAIAAYSQTNSYKTFSWPMFSARTRRTLQINCNGWSDFTPAENVNGSNVESNEWTWTKQVETGEVDDEQNPIMAPSAFDDNWHFVTITFNGVNAKYYVDGEIMNEWNATANNYSFAGAMNALDAIYLGDCGPFWQDKDGAYAYDDIAFYSTELNKEQIDLLINIKRDQLSEDDKLIIARTQLEEAKENLTDYCSNLGETFDDLNNEVLDWLMDNENGIGDADRYTTMDEINAALTSIQKKQEMVNGVVKAHTNAMNTINYYTTLCDKTSYPGADTFKAAITAATQAISNPKTEEVFAPALATLETAKKTYIFTQEGDTKDVTRVISAPWFVDEAHEPTVEADGSLTYDDEAASNLTSKGWTMSFSESLRGATDCTLYFTNDVQKRTTANLFHSSTAIGTLDIQQTITGLPAGFYSVSADMSSTSDPTDNHVYATASGVTKTSPVFSLAGGGWTAWETLTTDKVRVGEDGTLTIGAQSNTDGTQYKGWFCVTNFQLTYHGTDYDMSTDVTAKAEEVKGEIENLLLAGDKAEAAAKLESITASESSDYDKVSQLTDLLKEVKNIHTTELAFNTVDKIEALENKATDENVKNIYSAAAVNVKSALAADGATINDFEALNALFSAYVSYAETAAYASTWETASVTDLLASQIQDIASATAESLAADKTSLTTAMKASIPQLQASETEPKDVTGIIGNASFDGDASDAWTVDIDGGTTAVRQGEVEFYNNNTFQISQLISGLPKGTYRLAASGFYRDGNNYTDIVANQRTKVSEESDETIYDTRANVALFAATSKGTRDSKLVSIASDSVVIAAGEDDSYQDYYGTTLHVIGDFTSLNPEEENVVNYPYWMSNAYHCITNLGKYADNNVVFIVASETDDITIGAKKTAHIDGDWTILDNFRLYYLGQEIPDGINETPASAASATPSVRTLSGITVSGLQRGINIVTKEDGTRCKVLVK